MAQKAVGGHFDERGQPRIKISVAGRYEEAVVNAVIDTGFNGDLCLPIEIGIKSGLELKGLARAQLADGTIKRELLFTAVGKLGRKRREVDVLLTESEDALVGVNMLSYLELDFVKRIVRVRRR